MAGMKEIPLSELSLPQINQLSQQLEQEIELLQNSLGALKLAQGKFTECKESLIKVTPEILDKGILVPLTSSMYVGGQISNAETVLVDIGTGYYVEMKVEAAKSYYQRKVEFLTSQMEKLQPVLHEKVRFKEALLEILQSKVQSQLAAQQQMSASS